jgi:hypothetical protein
VLVQIAQAREEIEALDVLAKIRTEVMPMIQ